MASLDDLVSTLQGGVENIGKLIEAVEGAFPRINGTFTLSAGTTTVVTQAQIAANGIVIPFAKNAAAALVVRTAGLYQSAVTSGAGFSMSTQSGTAAGTETFSYIVINPS